jgi:hypothetical protein
MPASLSPAIPTSLNSSVNAGTRCISIEPVGHGPGGKAGLKCRRCNRQIDDAGSQMAATAAGEAGTSSKGFRRPATVSVLHIPPGRIGRVSRQGRGSLLRRGENGHNPVAYTRLPVGRAVNYRGVWACTKHELRQMRQQGSGAIVNCSSIGGLRGGGRRRGRNLSAAVLLRLVVGRWGGCCWRPAIQRLHQ